MSNKKIYVVRHAQTEFNKMGIVQGSGVDAPLNDWGRQQARAFYDYYKEIEFDLVLSSKLIRTHQTMEGFIESGIPWEQHATINEMGWGVHEGKKSTPEAHQEYRNMIAQWTRGNYDAKLEGGESAAELSARMSEFIEHIKGRSEQKILVCSHGRAMRCMMALLKNDPLYRMEEYKHSNTGLFIVDYWDGSFQFQLENDCTHLELIKT